MKSPPSQGIVSKSIAIGLVVAGLAVSGWAAVAYAQSAARGQSASDKPARLRWKFSKGQQLEYLFVLDTTAAVSAQNSTLTFNTTWQIDSVDGEGTAEINYTFDRVRVNATFGNQPPFDADSAKKNAEGEFATRMAAIFDAMVGKPGRMTISALGKVSNVELPEGMADKLKSAPALGQLAALFNEGLCKRIAESSALELPEKAVTAGQTWTQSQEIKYPGQGRQTLKTTYTFEGVENRGGRTLAKIAPEVEVDFPDAEKSLTIAKQDSSGTIYFDTGSGRISQLDVEHSMQMEVTVMGQKFSEDIGTVTSLKLTSAGGESKASSGGESKTSLGSGSKTATGKQSKPAKKKP